MQLGLWHVRGDQTAPRGPSVGVELHRQNHLCVVWKLIKRIKRRVKPQFCLVQVQVGGVGPVLRRAFVTLDLGLACPLHQLPNGLVPPELLACLPCLLRQHLAGVAETPRFSETPQKKPP